MGRVGLHHFTAVQADAARYFGTVGKAPFYAAFINGGVGAFGLAGAAIDALFGNVDGHRKTYGYKLGRKVTDTGTITAHESVSFVFGLISSVPPLHLSLFIGTS